MVPNNAPGSAWDDGLFMGLGNQAGYVGTYDADISWAFDNFNAESCSNHSAEYDQGMKCPFWIVQILTFARKHI